MPRVSKRNRLESKSDDDFIDDDEQSTSTASQRMSTKSTSNRIDSGSPSTEEGEKKLHGFTPVEITQLSHNIVKYILQNSTNKFPFKRIDVIKNVLNGNAKIFDHCFGIATEILKSIFGFVTVVQNEVKQGKQYILYSEIQPLAELAMNAEDKKEVALLFLVLSYIYMKGGEVSEMALFNVLSKLNINETEEHAYFGNIEKLIKTTFPKMLYIKRTKLEIEGIDEEKMMLTWGQRADLEVKKKELLISVSKIMGKQPAAFIKQFGETHGEDGQAEQDSMVVDDSEDSS